MNEQFSLGNWLKLYSFVYFLLVSFNFMFVLIMLNAVLPSVNQVLFS